jgi:uncharacterized membrane protein (UPF0136 family)
VPSPAPSVARLRGTCAGAFTAALAIAAHGVGTGMVPTGGAAALLGVLAAAIGGCVTAWHRTSDARVLVGVLAGGQLLAHLTLTAAGAEHGGSLAKAAPPTMLAAHAVAVVAGAILVTACARLHATLSSVIRTHAGVPARLPSAAAPALHIRRDPPPQRAAVIAASISHRGPPVSVAR